MTPKQGGRLEGVSPGDSLPKLTDPCRRLEFAVGSREDFICFDFSMIDNQTFVLHSVIHTSGCGFLSDAAYCIVPAGHAVEAAYQMVREARQWCGEYGIEHDGLIWSSGPGDFLKAVQAFARPFRALLSETDDQSTRRRVCRK